MRFDKILQCAVVFDRLVWDAYAYEKGQLQQLLFHYGGEHYPAAPPLLEWLRHILRSAEADLEAYEAPLTQVVQSRHITSNLFPN